MVFLEQLIWIEQFPVSQKSSFCGWYLCPEWEKSHTCTYLHKKRKLYASLKHKASRRKTNFHKVIIAMDMLLSEDLETGMWPVMIKCNKWIDSLDVFEVPGVYCMKFINYIMRYWEFEMVLDPRTILTLATKTWNPPLCWKF